MLKYCVLMAMLCKCVEYGYSEETKCIKNEVESNCVNMICAYTHCSQIGHPIECTHMPPKYCQQGCVCKNRYLKANNGSCIPIPNCPNNGKCKENEYYELCPSKCHERTCDNDTNYVCSETLVVGDPSCYPAKCVCKEGFYKNKKQECVALDNCVSSSVNTTESPSVTTTNNPVPPLSPPLGSDMKKCGPNERYEENPCSTCRVRVCSELGYQLPCSKKGYSKNCKQNPGCFCAAGYVRNNASICVLIKNCPSCGGDPNAESGCGIFCLTCWNTSKRHSSCRKHCIFNGCECKRNYVYNHRFKKCVLPTHCCKY